MEYLESSSPNAFNPKYDLLKSVKSGKIENENLFRSILVRETLVEVRVEKCRFESAQIIGAKFDRCRFSDSAFVFSEINDTRFEECFFHKVSFATSALRNARFERCTFEDCQLEGAILVEPVWLKTVPKPVAVVPPPTQPEAGVSTPTPAPKEDGRFGCLELNDAP